MRSTLLPLAVAAALAVTACGTDEAGEPGAEPSPSDATSDLAGEPIDADVVLLAESTDATIAPPTVLAGPAATQAYPGWYSSEPRLYRQIIDAFAGLPDYPSASRPLLAFTNGPTCEPADAARLMADGVRVYADFEVRDQGECEDPSSQIAIFTVDRSALPDGFRLVGTGDAGRDRTAGPGELLAFEELETAAGFRPPQPREITDGVSLDAFARSLPSHQNEIRGLADELGGDQTILGFVVSGCAATSAELVVTPRQVTAAPVGGETVRCIAPVFYAAVFAVPPDTLPEGYTLR